MVLRYARSFCGTRQYDALNNLEEIIGPILLSRLIMWWESFAMQPGPHLNIKTVFPGMEISIIKMRWLDHLMFIMGILIMERWHLYIGMAPQPCTTTAMWRCHNLSNQWQRRFQLKLRSHWVRVLRQCHINVAIQGPAVRVTRPLSSIHLFSPWLELLKHWLPVTFMFDRCPCSVAVTTHVNRNIH